MLSLLYAKLRGLFSIRVRLVLASALLVVAPLAGISFARTYERELLRAEEEEMVAIATALAAGLDAAGTMDSPAIRAASSTASARLGAQLRLLGAGTDAVLFDTGPERIRLLTRGRALVPSESREVPVRETYDDVQEGRAIRARPEVAVALRGQIGRATRRTPSVRGVRLFIAVPVRGASREVIGVVYLARSTYPVLVSLYRVRNGLVRVAVASVLLAVVVAVFLGRTISRPLEALRLAANRIAAGERGVALNVQGRDELADLARAFEVMARELDARLGYISDLAANVSHEFKTPLASIRGAAELLADGAADDLDARQRFLGNILADVDRTSRLVSRLLELSRIESRIEPRIPLDLRALWEDVIGRYRAQGSAIEFRWSASVTHLVGAPEQLDAVLTNLLDNALRATAQGLVRVAVTEERGSLVTTVTDRGRGISEANLARVWERFFTTDRATGGTGLGLSIVRAIVEAHGGGVSVRSTEGEGTTFRVTLPRRL